jgi:hypothetical protein
MGTYLCGGSPPPSRPESYRRDMPDQAAAVEISHPPQAVLRAINPLLHLALRTPVLGPALKEFMVVSFTGRKTGRRFSIPVSAHHIEGDLYVLLSAGWKYNFRDGASADVLYAGKTRTLQGQLITEPATVADLAHRAATSQGAKRAQRAMGLRFRDGKVPSVEEFTEASNRLGLAAIRLT